MLRELNLSLEQAIRPGQSAKEIQKHVKALKQDAEISKINRTYSLNQNSHSASNLKSNPPNKSSALVIRKCKFYNGTHNKGNCPAYYRNCLKCNRKGHYSSCCSTFLMSTKWKSMLNLPHPTPIANFSLAPFPTKMQTIHSSPLKKCIRLEKTMIRL